MRMWTEMRTAMMVARLGTVRAAAASMGVHRATVTRHIDALEDALRVKLFLRHRDGYTLTSDGKSLQRLAESIDRLTENFVQAATEKTEHLSGTLTITSFVRASRVLAPIIRRFCIDHPDVRIQYFAETELSRLELGQADIAIRSGPPPTNSDYVVIPFRDFDIGLFGHKSYLAERGVPVTREDLHQHSFVGVQTNTGAIDVVDLFGVTRSSVHYVTNDPTVALNAIEAGIGLGVVAEIDAKRSRDLVEVLPRKEPRQTNTWIITHVDMHRTRLVQAFLCYLRPAHALQTVPLGQSRLSAQA
ncbi:MAG: LysR family transcriptional regulator [Pseudomonadota bacterium]